MRSSSPTLTEGSVVRHLLRLSVPASMGMIFNTLYNLSDFWFAGLLSDHALAGVSIAGSVFFLLIAFGIGIQTGASAVIAPHVGKRDTNGAAEWVDDVFGLSLVFSALIMAVGWWLAQPLVVFLGAETQIAPLSIEYVSVILLGTVSFILSFAAAGALMAFGDTRSNRNALMIGFFANLVLNPLLTFGFGLGVQGLAFATVLIKTTSALYLLAVLANTTGRWSKPRFSPGRWLKLLKQVVPASFNMLTIVLGGFITVSLIGRFGSEHVAGYAVGLRIEQVLLLPALGLNTAVMAIAGQNFGAGLSERVHQTYSKSLLIGVVMAAMSIPLMVFLSPVMMGLFTGDDTIIDTGTTYLRIDAIAFYAYVVLFISTATLQAIQEPIFPLIMGIARQLVLPAAINYWLIVYQGYPMISVFYTVVGTVVLAAIVSHTYTLSRLRHHY